MAKTERIFIRAEPEFKKKLQEQAEKERRSLSNYIEKILIKELKEQIR